MQAEADKLVLDSSFETPAMDYYQTHDSKVMLEMWPATSPYGAVTMFIANPEATISFDAYSWWSKGMVFHNLTDLRRVVVFTNSQPGSTSQNGCAAVNLARNVGDDILVENGDVVGGGGSFMDMGGGDIFYPNNPAYQFINLPISYPSPGYEGDIIPTSAMPTTHFEGTVDCGGVDPVSMLITQGGNNGVASLSPTSPAVTGRAQWDYDLASNNYMITVDCGGTLAISYATVSPASTDGNWVCDIYGEAPHYCTTS